MLWTGFKREEFACKCGCGFATVDAELLEVLKDLKIHFNNAVTIIRSGCRCEKHNADIGGAAKSKHKLGIAADVDIVSKSPDEVAEYLLNKYKGKYGIGRYATFTHIDVRPDAARWDNR